MRLDIAVPGTYDDNGSSRSVFGGTAAIEIRTDRLGPNFVL